ncbi:zinc metalloproteinase-disintegrin-like EoMP06 [Haliotis rufescens]|uniref:zinc metalloproteinase-disintegrin-like EoMP06 n=1 Tax=Haliotis rufescens TaxID=6454 RepID=UPI00201FA3BA|nr:zinc metalloproteinase-disintegrin-like EoMP06 [Haliotis rufescens]
MDFRLLLVVTLLVLCVNILTSATSEVEDILSTVDSQRATLRWLQHKENGQKRRYLDITSWLEIHLPKLNASITAVLVRNRNLIHRKFVTRVVHNGGATVHKETPSGCIYQGALRDLVTSHVVLTGCKAYSGYIFHKGRSWRIQRRTKKDKQVDGYVIRRVTSQYNMASACEVEPRINAGNYTKTYHRVRHTRSADVKLLELYVVFGFQMYTNYLGKDKTSAVTYAEEMTAHLDLMYKVDFGIRIALVGVEIWETKDEITMETDAKALLVNFIDYGKTSLIPNFNYDLAAFVAGIKFEHNIVGMAHVDVMCTPLSATVIQHNPGVDPHLKSAITLAHEIGHALGLVHDTSTCACGDRTGKCIMAADTSVDPRSFSQCSKDAVAKMFREGGASCLYDAPLHVYGGPVCGNGVKEQGEVCDCGEIPDCQKDPCCMFGCKLRPSAQCNTGGCCKSCKIVSPGMICRPKQNECDLEEFCDGKVSECPANLHLKDMQDCGAGLSQGFCYKGKCRSAHAQCQYLWGPGSTSAYASCYQPNQDGTATGNCGATRVSGTVTYTGCAYSNVMCGMLQCVTKSRSPVVGVGRHIINTTSGSHTCISVAIDLGDDVPDPGLVDDGSPCIHFETGNNQPGVCLARECVVLQTLPKQPCPKDPSGSQCSNHGICTNDNSCYCDDGFTGTDCSKVGGVTRIRPSVSSSAPVSQTTSPSLETGVSSKAPASQTPTPSSQPPTDHSVEIICGVVGGLIALGGVCFVVLWRCKRPKALWKWVDTKFGHNSTSPQKGPLPAWGAHGGKGNGTHHNPGSKPGIPSHGARPGQGRPPGRSPSGHPGTQHVPPGHWTNHGNSHGHGQGNGHRGHNRAGLSGGHGNSGGHGHGRHSITSDYGSQESIESFQLDRNTGPPPDAVQGEVSMTAPRRLSRNR